METLPVEMVIRIAQNLSPQDLVSSCGVSNTWRGIFNQDPLWKPHCDQELEQTLRTIPCTTALSPPLESLETSILPPLCRWRLAFMREQKFRRNWREFGPFVPQTITPDFNHDDCKLIDFLTDTLIIVFYSASVEILDVSTVPAVVLAKSADLSVAGGAWPWQKYALSDLEDETGVDKNVLTADLRVLKESSLDVYGIDSVNRSIFLKHSISMDSVTANDFKGNYYIVLRENWLIVFYIKTLKVLETCRFPFELSNNTINVRNAITTSSSSNLVAIRFTFSHLESITIFNKFYIFSLETLIFLPGIVVETTKLTGVALHEQYLAVFDHDKFTIYDCFTCQVILQIPTLPKFMTDRKPVVIQGGFVIAEKDEQGMSCIKLYIPSERTAIDLFYYRHNRKVAIKIATIHNRFITMTRRNMEQMWDVTGRKLNKCEIGATSVLACKRCNAKVNNSFTKIIFRKQSLKYEATNHLFGNAFSETRLTYTWFIKNLW